MGGKNRGGSLHDSKEPAEPKRMAAHKRGILQILQPLIVLQLSPTANNLYQQPLARPQRSRPQSSLAATILHGWLWAEEREFEVGN